MKPRTLTTGVVALLIVGVVGVIGFVGVVGVGAAVIAFVVLAPSAGGPLGPGGTYTIDVVRFKLATPATPATDPSDPSAAGGVGGGAGGGGLSGIGPLAGGPGIHIDTHIKLSGLRGGTVKSRGPYAIAFDYTDNAGDLARLEFTRVEVIYDDGALDPAAAALRLPLVTRARQHESVNSVAGGRVVRKTVRLLSGRIPAAITRDESFRLVLEGRFIRLDGTAVPFTIDQRWEVVVEQTTMPARELLQDK